MGHVIGDAIAREDVLQSCSSSSNSSGVDEWVFSVQVPLRATVGGSGRGVHDPLDPSFSSSLSSLKAVNTGSKRLLQLRQCQPPHPASVLPARHKNQPHSTTISNKDHKEGGQEFDEDLPTRDVDEVKTKEKEFLLHSNHTTINNNDNTGPLHPAPRSSSWPCLETGTSNPMKRIILGWDFRCPYWKIQSNFILQMTYRPAWQALPEYTHCRCTCAASSPYSSTRGDTTNDHQYHVPPVSVLRTVGSFCCGSTSAACRYASLTTETIDFFAHTWTTADIVHVETLDDSSCYLEVEGVGPCRAIRLTLSPLPLADDFPHATPPYLRAAWDSHVQRMVHSSSYGPRSESSAKLPLVVTAPTVTFALPLSQIDPPLLWKVDMPSVADNVDIAVETYSILDGQLLQRGTHTKPGQPPQAPTHIYINGFQSWSFAGSIVRGHEQPKPAMPNVFSQAFNMGGSPPPPATNVVLSSEPTDQHGADNTFCSFQPTYQSDFFTCITTDGIAPCDKRPNLFQSAVANVRSSSTGVPAKPMIEEDPFPFQKLDETGGPAVVLGWLSQRQQFGVITADRTLQHFAMHASADGAILLARSRGALQQTTDWAYVQLISPHSYDEEPMVHYLHDVAAHNHARPLQNGNLLTGWCSWYHYYNDITEANLRENFTTLAGMRSHVPTNVAVVDDGYMTAWGDWDSLKPRKFSSMGTVARDILRRGMRPGLWLAPFTSDKHARVTGPDGHPEWIIRNDFGAPANSANCGKFFYGLDATNPEVHNHVFEAIRRAVDEWEYDVLKIDFLYAACLKGNGKYNLSLSRAQAMTMALATIRRAAGPNVFLIGCGCPLASGIGYVDGMRISADTGPSWYPEFPLPWWDHGTLPCLRSMVRNSISRAPLGHRWWHNDPDCLLLGESTRLTELEVASAATVVAMTCGMMLLSDDLTKISPSRTKILTKIFPMAGASAVVLDLHSSNDGLPSLLRLWATDNHQEPLHIPFPVDPNEGGGQGGPQDYNHLATVLARKASFVLDQVAPPNERKRSCLYAPKGLGSWTIISLSNWSDQTAVLQVPPPALLPPPLLGLQDNEADTFLDDGGGGVSMKRHNQTGPPQHQKEILQDDGYHVLAFWSSRYSWLPPQGGCTNNAEQVLRRRLLPHETEIFHIKRVTPELPQYLGSDLHFSCCREVARFVATKNTVRIDLRTDLNRVGHVFVFLPIINTSNVVVKVHGEPGLWIAVGNTPKVNENGNPRLVGRIIRVSVTLQAALAPSSSSYGEVFIQF